MVDEAGPVMSPVSSVMLAHGAESLCLGAGSPTVSWKTTVCFGHRLRLLVQESDRKLQAVKGLTAGDVGYKFERIEHLVKNRDLVIDAVESRLARLEGQR